MQSELVRITGIVGNATDSELAEKLHLIQHQGKIEYVTLSSSDVARKRLRLFTDQGTECAIAIARSEQLQNGSVIYFSEDRAIVVRLKEERWLRLAASTPESALQLGFLAGHHHWRVRFDGVHLLVALEGPAESYEVRIAHLLNDGAVRIIDDQ
ncbi:MAG: urease accessory protein UreE [Gammaproteobacteria bacterium]|nr:urease accessory protein UreE [Gammaproteobacteria bacterium]